MAGGIVTPACSRYVGVGAVSERVSATSSLNLEAAVCVESRWHVRGSLERALGVFIAGGGGGGGHGGGGQFPGPEAALTLVEAARMCCSSFTVHI